MLNKECGCDNLDFLEINHKNGGGRKDNLHGHKLQAAINNGSRDIEDLEVVCRVCNAWHYLKLKFGETAVKNYQINYINNDA